MNCTEFEQHWNDLITNAIDESHRSGMETHAVTCGSCGPKWFAHQELETTIQSILEAHPMPKELATSTANETYQERFGSAVEFNSRLSTTGGSNAGLQPALLFTLVLGAGLFGFIVGSGRSSSNPIQQLLSAQMMLGGRGQNPQEMMLVSEVLGQGGSGKGLLPPVTIVVQTACLALALVWLTRSKLWRFVFPARLPIGIHVARWLGLLAALLGGGRCFAYAYASITLLGTQNGGRGISDLRWLTGSLGQINQLWAAAFWLTLLILILTSAERAIQSALGGSDRRVGPN